MQFQIAPDDAKLFADAVAALIRSRADIAQERAEQQAWHTLMVTFRDADSATLTVPEDAARLMFRVWGTPYVWRDEQTRQHVKAQLRRQWRAQMADGS
jgi:hypothetical protein